MKGLLYIMILMLLCIHTAKAESVTFSTSRDFYHTVYGTDYDSHNTERNALKNECAIQSNEHIKVEFLNPDTEMLSSFTDGVIVIGGTPPRTYHYYLWISAFQVKVSRLNEHAEIESIDVKYVNRTRDNDLGITIYTADHSTNVPVGQNSYTYTFAESNLKVVSLTVNYHLNHEYGENGAAYYTCQYQYTDGHACGYVNEARQAACADRALRLKAVGADMTIGMQKSGNPTNYQMEYSLDKQHWTPATLTTTTDNIVTIPAGQTCYFRHGGDVPIEHMTGNQNNCWSFTMTGNGTIEAGGNVMSMLDKAVQKNTMTPYPTQHALTKLFYHCDKLTKAPELPATTIGQFCYMNMFAGTGITEAPTLPATSIPDGAYYGMFQDCKNLQTVPALPGTHLSRVAYKDMFHGCEKLTSVEIAVTNVSYDQSKPADNPFTDWLTGTAVGTTGLLLVPNSMVASAKIILPENWQYKQIHDFIADIRQTSAGIYGALQKIATDYVEQINEASNYNTAKTLHDQAIEELAVLIKYNAFTHDESYADPVGAGKRVSIVTEDGKEYEFRLSDLSSIEYSMLGTPAQDEPNALAIDFIGNGNPIENKHMLEGTHITFSVDGEEMNLTVNGATAIYALGNLSGMSYFNGTPTVSLHANQDPDANTPSFYTTFYSGLEAYTLPEGVKAYTAEVDDDNIMLTRIAGNVLPQGEAVLLYSNELQDGNWTMEIADPSAASKSDSNQFEGVDAATPQDAALKYNMLSYGQRGLGFYKMSSSVLLSANKAFFTAPESQVNAFRMVFSEEEQTTGIKSEARHSGSEHMYSISGVRRSKVQRGINIVNAKKVIIK